MKWVWFGLLSWLPAAVMGASSAMGSAKESERKQTNQTKWSPMLRNQQTIKFIWLWSWMEQKEESSQSTKQQSNQSTFFNWGWLMELFGGLEWIVEFPLLWLGLIGEGSGLWPLAPNKQSKGNESMNGRKRKRAQWNQPAVNSINCGVNLWMKQLIEWAGWLMN